MGKIFRKTNRPAVFFRSVDTEAVARKDVPKEELPIANKAFSTGLILRHGSTIRFGHERAAL